MSQISPAMSLYEQAQSHHLLIDQNRKLVGLDLKRQSRFDQMRFRSGLGGICLIDLDQTLTLKTLAPLFGKWLCTQGVLTYRLLFKALLKCWLYRVGHLSFQLMIESAMAHGLEKKTKHELFDLAAAHSKTLVPSSFNSAVVALIEQVRPTHLLVLTSRSPDFLVSAIAKLIGFDHWQASCWCPRRALCQTIDGIDKAELLDQLLINFQLKRSTSIALSDSQDDIPLLQRAGRAIAVRPDRALRSFAKGKNWEIWDR